MKELCNLYIMISGSALYVYIWGYLCCEFGKLFLQCFTTEAVGSHNYQHTYSLLFKWQGKLLLSLTDILFYIYLPIADYAGR
jgi:hypothetical protein